MLTLGFFSIIFLVTPYVIGILISSKYSEEYLEECMNKDLTNQALSPEENNTVKMLDTGQWISGFGAVLGGIYLLGYLFGYGA